MSRNRLRACAATQYFEGRQLSARRGSAVRLGSAPRLARIIFLAMMVGFTSAQTMSEELSMPGAGRQLSFTSASPPPPPPPLPLLPAPSSILSPATERLPTQLLLPSRSPPPTSDEHHEKGRLLFSHSHSPHGHSPHSHTPHSHFPHSHTPHIHFPHSHYPHSHYPHSHYPVARNSSETWLLLPTIEELPTFLGVIIGLPVGGCLCLCLSLGLCLGCCLSRRRKEARGPPPLQRPTPEAHEPQPAVATKTNLTTQANLNLYSA